MSTATSLIKKLPGYSSLDEYLKRHYVGETEIEPFPRGHFYSPLPDIDYLSKRTDSVFNVTITDLPGIDLNTERQEGLLDKFLSFGPDFKWPGKKTDGYRYFYENAMFGVGSAYFAYSMARLKKPKKILEVGSGFSSALLFDTAERYIDHDVDFTFIEPLTYNSRLIDLFSKEDLGRCKFIKDVVQNVSNDIFRVLNAGDFLFIDSSHVSKTGSDVNFLLFNVLPNLKSGVVVHIHDIYWPFEYPSSWVLGNKWAWNEAYLLRAFLQYNSCFKIEFFCDYMYRSNPSRLEDTLNVPLDNYGSSLWIEKV